MKNIQDMEKISENESRTINLIIHNSQTIINELIEKKLFQEFNP